MARSRIVAVRTDPIQGTAKFGTVEYNAKLFLPPDPEVQKEPDAVADPHHPDAAVLITVTRGRHTIVVPARDGRSEEACVLNEGDRILFLDFRPAAPPAENARFRYSGHWSQAGHEGATLLPRRAKTPRPDLDALKWTDGLPLPDLDLDGLKWPSDASG